MGADVISYLHRRFKCAFKEFFLSHNVMKLDYYETFILMLAKYEGYLNLFKNMIDT